MSIGRITRFLRNEEIDPDNVQHDYNKGDFNIYCSILFSIIQQVNFSAKAQHLCIIKLTVQFKKINQHVRPLICPLIHSHTRSINRSINLSIIVYFFFL